MRRALVALLAVALSSALAAPVVAASEPSSSAELLPGVDLVTEEVEPGVLRIVDDGVRSLSRVAEREDLYMGGLMSSNIAAGRDGSVWVFWPDGFFRVGDKQTHSWGDEPAPVLTDDIEVAPNGTIWRTRGTGLVSDLRSFDGESWAVRKDRVVAFDMLADGSVWVMADEPDAYLRRESDEWKEHGVCAEQGPGGCWDPLAPQGDPLVDDFSDRGAVTDFAVMPVMHDWLSDESEPPAPEFALLAYIDDQVVYEYDTLVWWLLGSRRGAEGYDGGLMGGVRLLDMDDEGGYWAYQQFDMPVAGTGAENDGQAHRTMPFLVQSDGRSRRVYSADEGVPLTRGFYHMYFQGFAGFLEGAPDGSVWMSVNATPTVDTECDGLARFDGTTWTHYLRDTCIYAMDIDADGAAWVQAGAKHIDVDSGPVATYFIRPEAAEATE